MQGVSRPHLSQMSNFPTSSVLIQKQLGYAKARGHKDWRRLKGKLRDAGCTEEFVGSLDQKAANFLPPAQAL